MKTFKDLKFKPHPVALEAQNIKDNNPELWEELEVIHDNLDSKQAIIEFDNGKKLSIIFGSLFYSNGIDRYEVMDLDANEPRGYLTEQEVTDYMIELQADNIIKALYEFKKRYENTDDMVLMDEIMVQVYGEYIGNIIIDKATDLLNEKE